MLSDFIKALRSSNVTVSTAESIDANKVLATVGIENKLLLKHALSMALAKGIDDKKIFNKCFDLFFDQNMRLDETKDHDRQLSVESEDEHTKAADVLNSLEGETLLSILESDDQIALQQLLAAAVQDVQLQNIRIFTQRGVYMRRILEKIGIDTVDERLYTPTDNDDAEKSDFETLKNLKASLIEDVANIVDKNLLLYTANGANNLRQEILQKTPLARIEVRDFKVMKQLVSKLAKKLTSIHSRRRRKAKRGYLDVRQTIRKNIQYDGIMFDTIWKRVQIDRPKVIAICDVSGSVSQVARFLLLFLYSVSEIIPKVRSFAFSNVLGEVTELFENNSAEVALAETIKKWGSGSTDYGGALSELERVVGHEIDHRTTVLILGDARSNYGDPGHLALRRIHNRAKKVIWLNPEPRSFWDTGDSEMQKLGACCDRVEPCRTLNHLERIISDIARTAA
ncbi:VWA domain-containing protein [Gammaproteobacteria bacterium]|nr:VWA domain-containing protein [Gammaproteobacteria bacterium]